MEEIFTETQLLIPIQDGEKILRDRPFIVIDEQILFVQVDTNLVMFTQISEEQDYTADDYLQLPENAPYQLINGKLIFMAAPIPKHQRIVVRLTAYLFNYVDKNKLGEIFCSPTDVKFDHENIVQPDILYISIARAHIIQRMIFGAPEFIVEILSDNNKDNDLIRKKKLYGKYNVSEYWIVYPEEEQIEVFYSRNNEMQLIQTARKTDKIISKAIDGFILEVSMVFA
jgi:Uma2 family endonuclease